MTSTDWGAGASTTLMCLWSAASCCSEWIVSTLCQWKHQRFFLTLMPGMLMHLGQNLTQLFIAIISSDMAACTSMWHAQITDRKAPGDRYWYVRTQDVEWVNGVPHIVAEPHVQRICFYVQLPNHVISLRCSSDGNITGMLARSRWLAACSHLMPLSWVLPWLSNHFPQPQRGHVGLSHGDLRWPELLSY